FQIGLCLQTILDSNLHELTNALAIKNFKRIIRENFLLGAGALYTFHIPLKEFAFSIVSTKSKSHLSQIICTEAEEFRIFSNFVRRQSCTRNFNHRSELVINLGLFTLHYFLRHSFEFQSSNTQLVNMSHKRNHYLGQHFHTFFL